MRRHAIRLACAVAALSVAMPALAQEAATAGEQERDHRQRGSSGHAAVLRPYIEVQQVFTRELSPGDTSVTYTQAAAGVDASVQGRNNAGSVSLRYEHTFGYDEGVASSDSISGIARGYATVIPHALTVEAGGLATRTRVNGNGGASPGVIGAPDSEGRVYAAYAGPNLHTEVGDAQVNANYRIGYNRIEAPDAVVTAPGATPVDIFDDSLVQAANAHVGARPGDVLPVGVGVGGGLFQEDVSNLDQRVRDMHVRADVTVPVSPDLALVGGAGYEDVEVSARDVLRDAAGNPVIDGAGRFVTDKSSPRQLAYDVSGLIWDVGVMWRPSTRTALEAHVGRRYDSTTYYGTFAWAPSSRESLNVSVYDAVTGFGGTLNNALAGLPTEFVANRNPLTGDVTGCVVSLQGGSCLAGVLGSVRSAVFRDRGVMASYAQQVGRLSAGIGVGYDRRSFIAASGTILAVANGTVDENYWGSVYVSAQLGPRDAFGINAYASRLKSGFANAGDATVLGASAAYRRYLMDGLSANAAVALDEVDSDIANADFRSASALVGLRYDF
ncbi:MAG: preprotein translocase subunit YajC [Tsuneonella sp.]